MKKITKQGNDIRAVHRKEDIKLLLSVFFFGGGYYICDGALSITYILFKNYFLIKLVFMYHVVHVISHYKYIIII